MISAGRCRASTQGRFRRPTSTRVTRYAAKLLERAPRSLRPGGTVVHHAKITRRAGEPLARSRSRRPGRTVDGRWATGNLPIRGLTSNPTEDRNEFQISLNTPAREDLASNLARPSIVRTIKLPLILNFDRATLRDPFRMDSVRLDVGGHRAGDHRRCGSDLYPTTSTRRPGPSFAAPPWPRRCAPRRGRRLVRPAPRRARRGHPHTGRRGRRRLALRAGRGSRPWATPPRLIRGRSLAVRDIPT